MCIIRKLNSTQTNKKKERKFFFKIYKQWVLRWKKINKKSLISLFHHDKKWYKGNFLSKIIFILLMHINKQKENLDL